MPEIAYVNGRFGPLADAVVNIEDRGFQFGDATATADRRDCRRNQSGSSVIPRC